MIRFLALKSILSRKFISFLCILSIALSVSLFLLIDKLRMGVEHSFTNSISQADLVVGARSGPLNLLLYTVFHMGSPTNNISIKSYEKIKTMPMVDWTIPISLGDSYKGHRVVATDENFFQHYRFREDRQLEFAQGSFSDGIFDVFIGAKAFSKLQLKMGQSIVLSHGITKHAFIHHKNTPFQIKGVLKMTGTPVDHSIYISLEGMEAMHLGWDQGRPGKPDVDIKTLSKEKLAPDQITAFILKTKNRITLLGLQRFIANYDFEPLSAIIPAMTLAELWGMLSQVENALILISLFVIVLGFFSILISLYMSLNQRTRELSILRSIGVSAQKITILLVLEAFFLSLIGAVFGFGLQYLTLIIINPILGNLYGLDIPILLPSLKEIYITGGFVFIGTCFGFVPAIKAYQKSSSAGLS
jgi:putative ABC transport system permease protein